MSFSDDFRKLTGNPPFPWQESLYERFISHCGETLRVANPNEHPSNNIPSSCNLPTGLGKTSVVAIWLIALANHPDRIPRRLVYVVNRRTVSTLRGCQEFIVARRSASQTHDAERRATVR